MVHPIRVIKQVVLRIVRFSLCMLWLRLVEEYLAVPKLPVSEENHEVRCVIE